MSAIDGCDRGERKTYVDLTGSEGSMELAIAVIMLYQLSLSYTFLRPQDLSNLGRSLRVLFGVHHGGLRER